MCAINPSQNPALVLPIHDPQRGTLFNYQDEFHITVKISRLSILSRDSWPVKVCLVRTPTTGSNIMSTKHLANANMSRKQTEKSSNCFIDKKYLFQHILHGFIKLCDILFTHNPFRTNKSHWRNGTRLVFPCTLKNGLMKVCWNHSQ